MFKKILIANRGEIACRLIKTCRKMGIDTVAIYSSIDKGAHHTLLAHEAYELKGDKASETYLNESKIIEIAKKTGCDALHPGYGFLSENASFAKSVKEAGLTFIGPSPLIIQQMGDKITAKQLAEEANVPLVPGTRTALKHEQEIQDFAALHGYPLLLKAAAGGGGKGMRVVETADDISSAFTRTRSEAQSSFKDDRIFIEKYIQTPRHIEIQVLGDNHGNLIHLGERDCSLQRRHQKVIEESPSPFITEALRHEMIECALALSRKVAYNSVGTVEFIVTSNHRFYFLEMNTRLQVEHPVTEAVTGLDLVEEMIKSAANLPLQYTQDQIRFTGHAIEARLYAENPEENFMPSSGPLSRYTLPLSSSTRVDTGVREGDMVSIYYDPMIAKIITHGTDRLQALEKLKIFLAKLVINGLDHNANFLQKLLETQAVQSGSYHTHTIETFCKSSQGWLDVSLLQKEQFLCLSFCLHSVFFPRKENFPQKLLAIINNKPFNFTAPSPDSLYHETAFYQFSLKWILKRRVFSCNINGCLVIGQVTALPSALQITAFGHTVEVKVMSPDTWSLYSYLPKTKDKKDIKTLRSPLPGLLISLPISIGDRVKKGQILAVIEAMKMENTLKSPMQAVIKDILVKNNDSLDKDQIMIKFE